MENLNLVISPDFCAPRQVDLTIVRKLFAITDGNLVVMDEDEGHVMFRVIEKIMTIHDRHLLLDAYGTPIVTIKKKILSAHKRWLVFKGDSSNQADLLFSAKKSSLFQLKTELHVFLSGNKEESTWDFKVVGSWFERSCNIFNKNFELIAEMHKKHTIGSLLLGKDTFNVTVHPHVDAAFIVALIVILTETNKDD